ncbi:MAG TPA: hypothetical protein VG276_00300 [Actinomycetes bacterium]|nr:hypothetical protein [Actinomycetes bacterium]
MRFQRASGWRGRQRAHRGQVRAVSRGLAALAVAAAGCLGAAGAASAIPRPAQASEPVALVLVQRLTWDEATAAARLAGGPVAAGLVSTMPPHAPFPAQILSLAAAQRVIPGGEGLALVERFRAASPDGCYLGLPPVDVVAAPGMEAAGLLAVQATGTPPPPRPLAGDWAPAPGRVLALAVPDAAGLAAVLSRLPAGTWVLVAGLNPAPGRARMAPFLELGGQAGLVTSDSTRRSGLVALEDVCPTLAATGRRGNGSPIRVQATADPLGATTRLDRRVAALVTARTWAIPTLALAGALAVVLLALTWWPGAGPRPGEGPDDQTGDRVPPARAAPAAGAARAARPAGAARAACPARAGWAARPARGFVLLTLALPSGYLVASMVAPASGPAWLLLGVALGVALAIGAARLARIPSSRADASRAAVDPDGPDRSSGGRAGSAPAWLGAVLLALVAGDLLLGGHGLERPLLGGSAFDGERFYGLGNGYFALALASVMLVAAYAARMSPWAMVGLLAGFALVDGLPMLGADVGGALTAMLTAAAAWLLGDQPWPPARAASRGRGLARALAVAGLALAAGLAVAFGAGLVTGEPTHGSRFVDRLTGEGPVAAARVVTHQLGRNGRLLANSFFAWVGPIQVVVAGVLAARPPRALAAVLPERVRRVTLVGALGSVLLILLNDTGVTATSASGLFLLAILAWSMLRERQAPSGGEVDADELRARPARGSAGPEVSGPGPTASSGRTGAAPRP